MGPSIEEALQNALQKIIQEEVVLQAASRTDAGVHADQQIINFITSNHTLNLKRLKSSLNQLLPKDIATLNVEEMDLSFHPTLDCKAKEYRYRIFFGDVQLPKNRLFAWHFNGPLDLKLMEEAAFLLIGTRDFSSFCNVKKNHTYKDFIRTLYQINIEKVSDKEIAISILGDHFLYKMVRNIVGSLVYVGCGKIAPLAICDILNSKKRTHIGITAPAHGLTLHKIFYDDPLRQSLR